MESSEEENDIVPNCVTSYYFVDNMEQPISFGILPLHWSEDEIPDGSKAQLTLRGTANSGLQKIYKKVIAWKLELSCMLPEIYVLSSDKIWIKLRRPRKSFEATLRTILITVHFLHFVKKNPKTCGDALWNHLLKVFRSYEVEPSQNDLLNHIPLIKEAAVRDKDMKKSKYLSMILSKMSGKEEAFHEGNWETRKSKFVADAYGHSDDGDGDDDDDDDGERDIGKDELFDYVCALCDEGGDLLSCEGRCLRSFHPTIDAGAGSFCESLGYTNAQVEAIPTFLCKNCQYQQHQCFACGVLGSSIKSFGAEVFPCVSATCSHFYHPKCVAELLHPGDETQAEELQQKIVSGESFTCPAHKCSLCKHGEDKKVYELQFALCRRCPKAYHRKCLPKKIVFEFNHDEYLPQRAWGGLLPNRILIYCTDHNIISKLYTPPRNHILFPDGYGIQRSKCFGIMEDMQKRVKRMDSAVKCSDSAIKKAVTLKSLNDNSMSVSAKKYNSLTVEKMKSSSRNCQSNSHSSMESYLQKSKQQLFPSDKINNALTAKSVIKKASSTQSPVDSEMEKRILMLMKNSTSSFNMEEFVKKQKTLSTHSYSSKAVPDKSITVGKVEGSVKAVQAALKKLEEGCTIEDAKAVCEPEVLNQIIRWKIVDRLQWYVQDGDMIVDFCCGSNDFSCLMKEKLDKLKKRCSFKNYDLITPKNDFNFEKRDWLTVQVGELPAGSRLIMGLNPPFGIANKLIDQALRFKPKLIILIVPKDTKRLDEKAYPYDIIWEDHQIVSGKSFYLPGSVDVHDQQLEQWNVEAPPLYLWSRPDWTAKHKEIAQKLGHLCMEQREKNDERPFTNYRMEDTHDFYGNFSNIMEGYSNKSRILYDVTEVYGDNINTHIAPAKEKDIFENKHEMGNSALDDIEMYADMELSTPIKSAEPQNDGIDRDLEMKNREGISGQPGPSKPFSFGVWN